MFAGSRGPAQARYVLFSVPLCWLGILLAGFMPPTRLLLGLDAIAFLISGGLMAANVKMSPTALLPVAILVAALCAVAGGFSEPSEQPLKLALLGGAAMLFTLIALISAAARTLRSMPATIAMRVLGSWVAATGLLLVGWSIHQG
jgi:hypothetical protein